MRSIKLIFVNEKKNCIIPLVNIPIILTKRKQFSKDKFYIINATVTVLTPAT